MAGITHALLLDRPLLNSDFITPQEGTETFCGATGNEDTLLPELLSI